MGSKEDKTGGRRVAITNRKARHEYFIDDTYTAGMVLVGVGTFFAQAAVTGFVGQTAGDNRGVASGIYLACYFCGGLVGTAVLGRLFDSLGWTACVTGLGAALAVAALLTIGLKRLP